MLITQCLITESLGYGIYVWGIDPGQVSLTVDRCTIALNGGPGLSVLSHDNPALVNSIVWANGGGSFEYPAISPFRAGRVAPAYSVVQGDSVHLGIGILNVDPVFIDPPNGDYRLRPDSPAIDTGDPNSPPDPDGTRADMGAFYYQGLPDAVLERHGIRTELQGAFPNPFNPSVSIRYSLAEEGQVSLVVHNLAGQRVKTLVLGQQGRGYHTVVWDGADEAGRASASGVYLVQMQVGSFQQVRRMILVR